MTRKEQEKQARKKDILSTALALFAEKGFHEVTVNEIAREVGLSKGTLYLYFKSKENLFYSVILDKHNALLDDLQLTLRKDAPFLNRLECFIRSYLQFFKKHQSYYKIIHCEKGGLNGRRHTRFRQQMMVMHDESAKVMKECIGIGQKEGILKEFQPEIMMKALRGLLNSFAFQSIFFDSKSSPKRDATFVMQLFLNGARR